LAGLEVEQFKRSPSSRPSAIRADLDLPEKIANERGYEASGAFLLTIAND